VQEKEKGLLSEIVSRVNDLFEGDLTDDDRLIYVNNVLKGKLLESETLVEQAANNTKEQFAASPDLSKELLNAIMDALEAHTSMSNQALNSERVREGLKDVLLGPAQLYEGVTREVGLTGVNTWNSSMKRRSFITSHSRGGPSARGPLPPPSERVRLAQQRNRLLSMSHTLIRKEQSSLGLNQYKSSSGALLNIAMKTFWGAFMSMPNLRMTATIACSLLHLSPFAQ